ncbi:MAG: hypothetical protein R3E44_07870 [Paracoccaceae bacterium]
MRNAVFAGAGPLSGTGRPGFVAPVLLVTVGTLLAFSVLLSRVAADAGLPMLTYLAAALTGAGAILAAVAGMRGRFAGARRWLIYSAGAGVFMSVPSAMGYLSVAKVGAGYVSLTFAFPVLLTWVIAVALGLERMRWSAAAGVAAGLAGGLLLAAGKVGTGADGAPLAWTLLASAIPLVLALGNIYRTQFWPSDAGALPLAALTLLAGGLMTLPVATAVEGWDAVTTLATHWPIILTASAVIAGQMGLQFRLQDCAGPVYMSQIGSVASVVGATLAVHWFGERLPSGFWGAAILIALGAAAFHKARMAALRDMA